MQHQHQPGRSLEVLHTYTIEGMVYGRGLALAYRARDEQLEDQVVLEMSPRGEGWPDSDYLVQYRSIVTKVMRLRHPNVIATRDFVLQGDQFFVVKQYDSGLPLDVVLHGSDRTRFDLQSRESVVSLDCCQPAKLQVFLRQVAAPTFRRPSSNYLSCQWLRQLGNTIGTPPVKKG